MKHLSLCATEQRLREDGHRPVLRTDVSRDIHCQSMGLLYRLAFQYGGDKSPGEGISSPDSVRHPDHRRLHK